jgi:hypothetical protein
MRRTLPQEWIQAGTISDWILRLTPSRAAELRDALVEVLEGFGEAEEDEDGALPFVVNINAFLQPDAADRL